MNLRRAPTAARRLARELRILAQKREAAPWQETLGIASVGRFTYSAPLTVPYSPGDTATVRIGSFCSISEHVVLMPGSGHNVDWATTYPLRITFGLPGAYADGHPADRGGITIGNDVWIGYRAMILSGVTIGDGAVIGAGAVVAHNVRPYAIEVGNPAREIRRRFDDETVNRLQALAWWDWPLELIKQRTDLLCDSNVRHLLDVVDPL